MVYNYVLRRVANREIAEDIVSEAYLNAARFFGRFDPKRSKFSTWVISIARNCTSDYFAREVPSTPLYEVPEGTYADEGEERRVERIADVDLVEQLLVVLSEEERELAYLKYYEGKRNTEIAEELDINVSTVSTKLSRAMAKMRALAS